jgi:hypothetical protein
MVALGEGPSTCACRWREIGKENGSAKLSLAPELTDCKHYLDFFELITLKMHLCRRTRYPWFLSLYKHTAIIKSRSVEYRINWIDARVYHNNARTYKKYAI